MRPSPLFAALSLALAGVLWIAATPRPRGGALGVAPERRAAASIPQTEAEAPPPGARTAESASPARVTAAPRDSSAPIAIARVRVVDELGRPVARVPVGLHREAPCASTPLALAHSDADGEAELALEPASWKRLAVQAPVCYVAAAAPVRGRVGAPLELGGDLAEPLVLSIGATGALKLCFEPGALEVDALSVVLEPAPSERGRHDGIAGLPAFFHECEGLTLELPHVALGVELALRVRSDAGRELGNFVVAGPTRRGETRRGETREHVLALAPTRPRVRARLVESGGGPIAETDVRVRGVEEPWERSARTDAEGRLELDGWTAPPAGEVLVRFELRGFFAGLRAEARVPRGAPGEEIDVGTLTLQPPPVLAAGRVLDERNEPVRGARVMALQAEERGDGGRPILAPVAVSGSDGGFVLRAWPPEDPFVLQASAGGQRSAPPVRIDPGATELVLRLAATGGVYGWVMYEEGLASEEFVVELLDLAPVEGGQPGPREARLKRNWEDGFSFVADGLPPGSATVRVRLRAEAEPLAVVPGVEVPAGGQSYDKRLQGIDLSGLLRRHELEVLDERGAPVAAGRVRYAPAFGAGPEHALDFEGGRAQLVTRAGALDLFVGAPGFRTRRVEGASGRARVTLEPALELRVELAQEVALPEGRSFELRLEPRGALVFDWRETMSGRFTHETRALRLLLPEPGDYALDWRADGPWHRSPDPLQVGEHAAPPRPLLPPPAAVEDLYQD